MDSVATMPPKERADLFVAAAGKRAPKSAAIMEKDFWVCWMLKRIFGFKQLPYHLIFKGGTSLSKVFRLIERFSEDVDLSFDRRELGFDAGHDPEEAPSRKKQRVMVDELQANCEALIRDKFVPVLVADCQSILGNAKTSPHAWNIEIDSEDRQTVLFRYPQALSLDGITVSSYIRQEVRLELGARSDHWPEEKYAITPYAAELFPQMFQAPSCEVNVLEAVRTFWEKATLLHKEAHRAGAAAKNERISRHYYDLYMLSRTDVADKALKSMDILERVIEHTTVFFPATWAHYETARPGSFRLVPQKDRLLVLKGDYAQMKVMIFGEYPKWDDIVEGLKGLEERINK